MLALKNAIFIKFIWREATTRKHEVFSSLALNSYYNCNNSVFGCLGIPKIFIMQLLCNYYTFLVFNI